MKHTGHRYRFRLDSAYIDVYADSLEEATEILDVEGTVIVDTIGPTRITLDLDLNTFLPNTSNNPLTSDPTRRTQT